MSFVPQNVSEFSLSKSFYEKLQYFHCLKQLISALKFVHHSNFCLKNQISLKSIYFQVFFNDKLYEIIYSFFFF